MTKNFIPVLCILATSNLALGAPATDVVVPGGLVTWSGSNISSCTVKNRSWQPRNPARCIYPIDLLHKSGSIKITRKTDTGTETQTIEVADYPYAVQHIELKDDSKVNLSQSDLERVGKENKEIRALWPLETKEIALALPLTPPLTPLPPGGRFGAKRIINGQHKNPHSGVDYGAAEGTPVLAVAGGRIALTGDHFFAGNSVFIDHGDGLISMYFHLNQILVTQGQTIRQGDPIAKVGSTGRATGPHLHYGLRWHGQRINPELLFSLVKYLPQR